MGDAKIATMMKSYAAKGGISAAEIKKLDSAISGDLKVSKAEYQALVAAKKQYGSTFSPATAREFDRLINPLALSAGGKVVNKFSNWSKAWKIDQDANFRQKWGITDKNDLKAPTFSKNVPASKVPAVLRDKFTRQVGVFFKDSVSVGDGGGKYTPHKPNKAEEIFSRDGKSIGWSLTYAEKGGDIFLTQFYRKDGFPAGGEAQSLASVPYD